jgi:hypothetical protein
VRARFDHAHVEKAEPYRIDGRRPDEPPRGSAYDLHPNDPRNGNQPPPQVTIRATAGPSRYSILGSDTSFPIFRWTCWQSRCEITSLRNLL